MENIIEFTTATGDKVYVEVEHPTVKPVARDAAKLSVVEDAPEKFEESLSVIKTVAQSMIGKIKELAKPKPDQAEVEFGIMLKADLGAIIAKAGTQANFRVKLTWKDLNK